MKIVTFIIVGICLAIVIALGYFGLKATDQLQQEPAVEVAPEPVEATPELVQRVVAATPEPIEVDEVAPETEEPTVILEPVQPEEAALEPAQPEEAAPELVQESQEPQPERVEELDNDSDGIIDVRKYFEGDMLKRAELDKDGDGEAEIVSYYEKGVPVTQEADLNNDGRTDTWAYFKDGIKVKQEMDKNHDGVKDAWFYYSGTGIDIQGSKIDEDFDGIVDKVIGDIPEE